MPVPFGSTASTADRMLQYGALKFAESYDAIDDPECCGNTGCGVFKEGIHN